MRRFAFYKSILKERQCAYCNYLKGYVSWWCMNDKACNDRGTRIPGVINCPYFKIDKEYIRSQFKKEKKIN